MLDYIVMQMRKTYREKGYYHRKMRGYPQFSFWMSKSLVKMCFSHIFSKPHKNTFELVGTDKFVFFHPVICYAAEVWL